MRVAVAMRRFKLPSGVRWSASGIIEATLDGQCMICGVITNDNLGPKVQRAFVEVTLPLKTPDDDVRKAIERAVIELAMRAKI